MSECPSPTDIQEPSHRRLAYIGATSAGCALAWLASIGTAPTSAAEDMPFEIFATLLAAAVSLTIVAVLLAVTYANGRAVAANQRCIATALGQLAAEQEQLAERMGRIDPWTIYTAVYEDLLKDRRN